MIEFLCGMNDSKENHKLIKENKYQDKNFSSILTDIDPKNTKLHIACFTENKNSSHILSALETHPQDIFTSNSSWELPLHYACLNDDIPYPYFKLIHDSNPNAVYTFTKDRCLPIHYYCRIGAPNPNKLRFLLHANPASVYAQAECLVLFDSLSESRCYSNFIRLACAKLVVSTLCSSPYAAAVISLHMVKLSSNPATFWNSSLWRILDRKKVEEDYEVGWTPLHLAVISNCGVECIMQLLEGEALESSLGRTALDCAWIMMKHMEQVENYSLIEIDEVNVESIVRVLKNS